MGILLKTLSSPSSHSAKKDGALWPALMERLTDCVLPADLDAFELWVERYPLETPETWHAALFEMIEKRREEIAQEEVGAILRDRFDFT